MNSNLSKLALLALLISGGSNCFSQNIPPLEPISKHYKVLAALSAAPNPARAAMDTIVFPWTEYSTGALMNKMNLIYLGPEDSAKLHGLIHYPANSSDQTRIELNYLLSLQGKRTKKEIERCQYIANISPVPYITDPRNINYLQNRKQLFFVAESVASWINATNFPATAKLMMGCIQDIRLTEFHLKRDFKRSRPYNLEPKLDPIMKIQTPAFPSGHTLWAFGEAFVLGEIIPQHRQAFVNAAEEVRWSREVMGIHFPSDNEAARVIAWNLLQSWYHNPQFVNDMKKAKEEWEAKKSEFESKH